MGPTTQRGGLNVTALVTITEKAPAGGFTVDLTGSSGLVVPKSVVVQAGEVNAEFTVGSSVVTKATDCGVIAYLADGSRKDADLKLIPYAVKKVEFDAKAGFGGTSSTATVTIDQVAPKVGLVVTFSAQVQGKNTNDVVFSPVRITIPEGKYMGTTTVTTHLVKADETVVITAKSGDSSATTSFVLKAYGVKSITLSKTTVYSLNTLTATVTLNGRAPEGGAEILLDSSAPKFVKVPANITMKAGDSSVEFAVTAGDSFEGTQTGTFTAIYNNEVKSETITVVMNQVKEAVLSPASVAAGKGSVLRIVLEAPATANGQIVVVGSTNKNIATAPATVTIPAGQTEGTAAVTAVAAGLADLTAAVRSPVGAAIQKATLTVTK